MAYDGKCHFLHAAFDDDWIRCPHPEQIRRYRVSRGQESTFNWYCDEGAEEARAQGFTLELSPPPPQEPNDA
jgi:hypothetical protein